MEPPIPGPCSLNIPNDPTTSSGPLTPDNVTFTVPPAPQEDNRPLSPTMFTNGRDPVNISAKHLKDHPLHEPTGTSHVLTFYPTMEEFKDFNRYIKKIEKAGGHLDSGIAKIVAPEGWTPRPSKTDFSDTDSYEIASPSTEIIRPIKKAGVYFKLNDFAAKPMKVTEYRSLALSTAYRNPKPNLTGIDIEKHYFDNILTGQPIYGADTEGSFYDKGVKEWNMNNLGTVLNDITYEIKGVNTVYLYFGMWKTTFPWHAEDMDLYSINYLHFGAPKYWFAISSEHADRFERFMVQQFSYEEEFAPNCKAFLRHKTCIITPELLRSANIPYATMIQRPNEFIITFPRGYHMGFNLGYNLAESTNFATQRWIEYGKDAVLCDCSKNAVHINMGKYMEKYRERDYPMWNNYWYEGGRYQWILKKKKEIPRKRRLELQAEAAAKRARLGASINGDESCSDGSGSEAESTCFMKSLKGYDAQTLETKPDYDELMRKFRNSTKLLRSNARVDLYQERMYNQQKSAEWPHCAVCQYFQPSHMCAATRDIPQKSRRLIPTWCFSKSPKNDEEEEEDNVDRLLTCSNCNVTVHSLCCSGYQPRPDEPWRCPRCHDQTETQIRQTSCQLCELRGGALIPCQTGKDSAWVHVVCALFNRRAVFDRPDGPTSCFVEPPKRQLSETVSMPPMNREYRAELGDLYETSRWACIVCHQAVEGLTPCVLCIEESPSTMPTLAHITCARRVGFSCEIRDHPRGTVMICHRHDHSYLTNRSSQHYTTVKPQDQVYVEDESNEGNQRRIFKGTVESIDKKPTVVVDFLDNSCSRDNLSEDIQSCECIFCENGEHQYGARIKVIWDDKKVYDAYYRGKGHMLEYTIALEDGRVVKQPRSKIKTKRELNSVHRRT